MADDAVLTTENLNGVAAMHHEIYLSYLKAGFSEVQALELLKVWIPKPTPGEG